MRIPGLARLMVAGMLSLVCVAAPAAAQFTVYRSINDFNAVTSNRATDTFNDLAPNSSAPSPLNRAVGPYAYQASSTNGLFTVWPSGTTYLSVNFPGDLLRLSNFSPIVQGVGGYFFSTLLDGTISPGIMLTITAMTTGNVAQTFSYTPLSATDFFGLVSSDPIVSFVISTPQTVGGVEQFATTSSVVLAGAAMSGNVVVPEPATGALLIPALAGVAFWQRRRRHA